MNCPHCGHTAHRVIDTRDTGDAIRDDNFLKCSSATPSQGVGLLGLILTALLLRPRRRG